MAEICSIAPIVGDSNIPSRLFTSVIELDSILTNQIRSKIDNEFGSLRDFATYIFKESQENNTIKSLQSFYKDTNEPSLQSIISVLNRSETNSNIKDIYNFLSPDKTYNPTITFDSDFTRSDINYSNLLLGKIYLQLISKQRGTVEEHKDLKLDSLTLKPLIVKYLREDIEAIKQVVTNNKFNDDYIRSYFKDILNENSYVWNEFTEYLNNTYGINLVSYEDNPLNENFDEGVELDSENIEVSWDDTVNERINKKKTAASRVKINIALLLNDVENQNSDSNKLYLQEPLDINKLWSKLIHLHSNDITEEDVINTLKRVVRVIPSFKKVVDYMGESETVSNTDSNSFRASYINSVKLAITPVSLLNIEKTNREFNVTDVIANQDAFAHTVYTNKFERVVSSGIESGLYNKADLITAQIKTKPLIKGITAIRKVESEIINAINTLNLGLTPQALRLYMLQYEDSGPDNITRKYNEIISSINYILKDVVKTIDNSDNVFNERGNISFLATVTSYDFNAPINLTYQDSKGQLNYSAKDDSLLTKFFRGLKVRGKINEDFVHKTFDRYLNDESLLLDNLLHYDDKTGIGIFDENGNIVKSFLNQLTLFEFTGIKLDSLGLKYRNLQSSSFAFVEVLYALMGKHLMLTSDSPRSYGINITPLETETLYNNDGTINNSNPAYVALSKIVQSQINDFNKAGSLIFNLPDTEAYKYHSLKYQRNGKFIIDGIPQGRAFKFLDVTYNKDLKPQTLIHYVAEQWNTTVDEVYKDLVTNIQNGTISQYNLSDYVYGFISQYINWSRNTIQEDYGDIQYLLLKSYQKSTRKQLINISNKDSQFVSRVEEEYQNLLAYQKSIGTEINSELEDVLKQKAHDTVLADTDLTKLESFKDAILNVLLNHTIYNVSFNNLIDGKLSEYKQSIDYNKRIAQVIKNGFNSLTTDTKRSIVVMEDIYLKTNIANELFGNDSTGTFVSDRVRALIDKSTNSSDSMSIMTDVGLERFLKSNGRWSEFRQIIEDIRNSDKTFDVSSGLYSKLIEQLKLFGTARRSRGEMIYTEDVDPYFKNQIESVQVKDSTIVLFKNLEHGKQTEQLYDWMISHNIDQVSPISSVKVSGITPLRLHDENGNIVLPEILDSSHVINLYQSDFVVQQDIPADLLDEEITFGNQLQKQIIQGLNWNESIYKVGDKTLTGKELEREFQKVLSIRTKLQGLKLFNDLGILDEYGNVRVDSKGNIKVDTRLLTQLLQESIQGDDSNINLKAMLEMDENGISTFPLSSPIAYGKLERIITSKIFKNVLNAKLPGFHGPIRADIFNNPKVNLTSKFKAQSQEDYNKTIDDILADTTITYADEFIEDVKKGNRTFQLQSGHTYVDGQQVHYAEVIMNPWLQDFYKNITKSKTLSNGKEIVYVDINKISEEGRTMLGIRIPTEGKQSMVVFKVVGFLNSGATQIIFPYTLVTQTGWDFDIDSIFGYYKHLSKSKQGEYTPVKFDSVRQSILGQQLSYIDTSILRRQVQDLLLQTEDSNGRSILTYGTKEQHVADSSVEVTRYDHRVLFPMLTIFDSDADTYYSKLQNVISKLQSYGSTQETRDLLNRLNRIFNNHIDQNISEIRIKTIQLLSYVEYDSNLDETIKSLSGFIDFTENEKIEIYSRHERNYSKKKYNYYSSLPESINKNIASIESLLEESKDIIYQLQSLSTDNNSLYLILADINLDALYTDPDYSFKPFDELKTIQESIDNLRKDYISKFSKKQYDEYELKTPEQLDNYLLDLMISVLTNGYHIDDTTKPNVTTNIVNTSKILNDLWSYTMETFNPNNLGDKIRLNNISMGSRELKGISVNNDNINAILSTKHAKFAVPIYRAIDISSFPLINGKPLKITNGQLSDKAQVQYLIDRLGLNTKNKLPIKVQGNKLIVGEQYIYNDAVYQNLDISGEPIGFQSTEVTAAILDALTASLMFNLTNQTYGVFRILSSGSVTELEYNDGVKENPNRFIYAGSFISQPIIVDLVKNVNLRKLTDRTISDKTLIKKAFDSIRDVYERQLITEFSKLPNTKELEGYSKITQRLKGRQYLNLSKATLSNIKQLSGSEVDFSKTTQTYYSTVELQGFIKNRNSDNPITNIGNLIAQLEILKLYRSYDDIANKLSVVMFALKTETPIKTFAKADKSETDIADSYITKEQFRQLLFDKASKSLNKIREDVLNNISSKTERDNIVRRFNTLTTYYNSREEGFLVQDSETKDWFINGYPEYKINIKDFITYHDAVKELNGFSLLQTLKDRRNKISYLRLDYKPESTVLIEDRDVLETVFNGEEEGYIKSDGNGNILINDVESRSDYSSIQTRHQFGSWFASNGFGTIFAQRSASVRFLVNKYLIDNNKMYDEKTKKFIESHIIEYVTQIGKRSIIQNVEDSELRRLVGAISNEETQLNRKIISSIKDKLIVDNDIVVESFEKFVKLPLSSKIELIRRDSTLSTYLNNPEFKRNNVFNFIELSTQRSKNGYDILKVVLDDSNTMQFNDVISSISAMWNSNIPYIANTVRDLIVYAYYVEGFQFGYKVSKYIPIELLAYENTNVEYDNFLKRIGLLDIAEDISNYATNLRLSSNELINSDPSEFESFDINFITDALDYICRQNTSVNPYLPYEDAQKEIFYKTLKVATFGYLINNEGDNRGSYTIQFGDNQYRVILETKERVDNSYYPNTKYFSSGQLVYKRSDVILDRKSGIEYYVYYPVSKLLQNEYREHSIIDKLNIPDVVDTVYDGEQYVEVEPLSIEEHVVEYKYFDNFITTLKDLSLQRNEDSLTMDYILQDYDNDNYSEVEVLDEDVIIDEDTDSYAPNIEDLDLQRSSYIEGLTELVEQYPSSRSSLIEKLNETTDQFIYIGSSETNNKKQIYKSYVTKPFVEVDYRQHPINEANRISKSIQDGNWHIDGDLLEDTTLTQQFVNYWTSSFVEQLSNNKGNIDSVTTIGEEGFGFAVNKTPVEGEKKTYTFKEPSLLKSTVIKISTPSLIGVETKRDSYVKHIETGYDKLKKLNRLFRETNIPNAEEIRKIYYGFRQDLSEESMLELLREHDSEVMVGSLKRIADINNYIIGSIETILNELDNQDFDSIRQNANKLVEYKAKLSILSKLLRIIKDYEDIAPYEYEDVGLKEPSEDEVEIFESVYGKTNEYIASIKNSYREMEPLNNRVFDKIKQVAVYNVLYDSRNPAYQTVHSKITSRLIANEFNVHPGEENEITISQSDYTDALDLLFDLKNKDIGWAQRFLDSAAHTGVTALDINIKQYYKARDKNIQDIREIDVRLDEAISKIDPSMVENHNKLAKWFERFITPEGDLIDDYDRRRVLTSVENLAIRINNIVTELYRNTSSEVIGEQSTREAISDIRDSIKRFNDEGYATLTMLNKEEYNEFLKEVQDKSEEATAAYIKLKGYVELKYLTITTNPQNRLYKLTYTDKSINKNYQKLSEQEKEFLTTLRELIQKVVTDYDSNFILYNNTFNNLLPFVKRGNYKMEIDKLLVVPKIGKQDFYIDIDGRKKYILNATTLNAPEFYIQFPIRPIYSQESEAAYEKAIVKEFKIWYQNHKRVLKIDLDYIDNIGKIIAFNEQSKKDNFIRKRDEMTTDIKDIMRVFTNQLYQIKAVREFQKDFDLNLDLLDEVKAEEVIPNALASHKLFLDRVYDVPKINNEVDRVASFITRYSSRTFMWGNVTAGIKNVIKGMTDMIIESSASNFVDSQSIRSGITDMLKVLPNYVYTLKNDKANDITVALIKDFDEIYQDTTEGKISMTGSNAMLQIINQVDTFGYAPNNIGEYLLQFGMLLAATKSHRVSDGKIIAFNDFYNQTRQKFIEKVLTPIQLKEFRKFIEKKNEEIKKWEKRKGKTYGFNGDYIGEYVRINWRNLTKEQQTELIKESKNNKDHYKTLFNKLPTLESQLRLKDGYLSWTKESGLTRDSMTEFRERVKGINQSLHGIYNRLDRMYLQDNALGDMFIQFKKWVRPTYVRYFGRKWMQSFFNETLGAWESPIYKPFWDFFSQGKKAYIQELSDEDYNGSIRYTPKAIGKILLYQLQFINKLKFYYHTLPIQDQASSVKFAKHISAVAFFGLTAFFMGKLKPEDDEEDNQLYTHTMYTLYSVYKEVVEPTPIIGWSTFTSQMLQRPFVGQAILEGASDLLKYSSEAMLYGNETVIYDRGIYKGQDKRLVALKKMIPIYRQIEKSLNLESSMNWYKWYNPFV